MSIRESIIVMNSNTFEMFRSNAMETASLQADPMGYLAKWSELNIVIDEAVPDNVSEVWYKDVYEFHLELERIKGEARGDENVE